MDPVQVELPQWRLPCPPVPGSSTSVWREPDEHHDGAYVCGPHAKKHWVSSSSRPSVEPPAGPPSGTFTLDGQEISTYDPDDDLDRDLDDFDIVE